MKSKTIYCDVCSRRITPITDADFVEGKLHIYYVPTEAEPAQAGPTDNIEIIIRAQRKRISSTEYLGVNSVDLCRSCLDGILEDLICNPDIDDD